MGDAILSGQTGTKPKGTAAASDVRSGKTFSNNTGVNITGTLVVPSAPTGNAAPSDVLSGKTFSNASGTNLVGTLSMPYVPITARGVATVNCSSTYIQAVDVGFSPSSVYGCCSSTNEPASTSSCTVQSIIAENSIHDKDGYYKGAAISGTTVRCYGYAPSTAWFRYFATT